MSRTGERTYRDGVYRSQRPMARLIGESECRGMWSRTRLLGWWTDGRGKQRERNWTWQVAHDTEMAEGVAEQQGVGRAKQNVKDRD